MSRIRVKSKLIGNDTVHQIEESGIIRNQKITYYENDVKVTIILEENVVTLLRETSDYYLTLHFKENEVTNGTHEMKQFPMRLDAIITTSLLDIKQHSFKINYHLILGTEDLGNFTFLLEYEVDV